MEGGNVHEKLRCNQTGLRKQTTLPKITKIFLLIRISHLLKCLFSFVRTLNHTLVYKLHSFHSRQEKSHVLFFPNILFQKMKFIRIL